MVLGVGHSCITLILLSLVSITLSDFLCPKYLSDFLKNSHLLGFNVSPASLVSGKVSSTGLHELLAFLKKQ